MLSTDIPPAVSLCILALYLFWRRTPWVSYCPRIFEMKTDCSAYKRSIKSTQFLQASLNHPYKIKKKTFFNFENQKHKLTVKTATETIQRWFHAASPSVQCTPMPYAEHETDVPCPH